ncbi:allantoate permease [[Candida] railenensis]|uniref:Allantoate permease n=1 Tax=[Candida] railenensis TaxID=45579 RepID=A0A9P0W023_9ASCO|nr:allantoate permease [[Candida] railenensis]
MTVNEKNGRAEIAYLDVEDQTSSGTLPYLSYKKVLRKVDRKLLILYSVVYLFTQLDKNNISNSAIMNLEAAHGIKKQLDLSSQQWAWVLAAFYYPYLFFEPLATLLLKYFTPRIWQSRIMLTWGGISMCQAATKNFQGLVAVRFFLGLAEAGYYTSVLYHLSFWIKPRELPKRIAFFYSVGMLSGAVSGILAYGISYLDQKAGLAGWQWLFILEGLPTVLLGIFTFFFLPNFIEDAKFLTDDEKELLKSNLPESAPTKGEKDFNWSQIKDLLKVPTFYTYTLIWFFQGIGGWGISFVLPTIIYQLGFTDTAKTQLMAMPPSIAGVILLNILGQLAHKRIIKPFLTAFIMSLIQIICYIVLLTVNSNYAKYVMLIIATAISNSLYPILWPDRLRVLRGSTAAGIAIGVTNGSTSFMGIIGPQIYQSKFGPKYHVSYSCSIALCSVVSVMIALTWWLVARDGLLETEGALKDESSFDKNDEEYSS